MPKPLRRAISVVCGLGQYELRLNGSKVGDHVPRSRMDQLSQDVPLCYLRRYRPGPQWQELPRAMLGNGMYHVGGGRYAKFNGSFGPPKMILHLRLDIRRRHDVGHRQRRRLAWPRGQSRSRAFLAARTTMRGWNGPAGTSPASTMPDGRRLRWSKVLAAGWRPSRRRPSK